MDIEKPNFKKICHMYLRGLQNFPYIEKDFDAITDYELLCRVVDYLNQVIDNSNTQNTNITNLYNAFIELKNYVDTYFDENFPQLVNDKIDELVENGTLENILHSRLNLITIYDTLQDVLTSTNLVKDLTIETLGYYTINDDGGAKYKITDVISETEYQEELENGLYATLIVEDSLLLEQIGVYGDGIHDDTIKIQYALNNLYKYKLVGNKKYLLSDTIELTTGKNYNIFINELITINIDNKPLLYLNHVRHSSININYITGYQTSVPNFYGEYLYNSALLLYGATFNTINIKEIKYFISAFVLYSTGKSGAEGCYYNEINCNLANCFNLAHYINNEGAVNGNEINGCLHYIENWNNPSALDEVSIINEGFSESTIYTNNHNVINNMMIERPNNTNLDYYIADLTNASNFHINIDRIEIIPSLDLTKLTKYNSSSAYNCIILNTAWFTIPFNKARVGNNNIITSYTNYSSALLPTRVINSTNVVLGNFEPVSNDIATGFWVYYPRDEKIEFSGIFKNTQNINADTNYVFCTSFATRDSMLSNGIVYEINGGNPTSFTPIGSIRQVKGSSQSYIRLNKNMSANSYLFIDFTLRN